MASNAIFPCIYADTSPISSQDAPASSLRAVYEKQVALFDAQPRILQQFLLIQAGQVAEGLIQNVRQIRFLLPDQVLAPSTNRSVYQLNVVPTYAREQLAGGLRKRLSQVSICEAFELRLAELEHSTDLAVSTSVQLLRYAIARHMVYDLLPSGQPVTYIAAAGEDIPTIPADGSYYLPRWVAFDEQGCLLVSSTNEAEACLASMQRFMRIVQIAVDVAPYIVTDDTYQQKRVGMLGQLVSQGRALAWYEAIEVVQEIQRRAAVGGLNRGFWVSLPYFDDVELTMRSHRFTVIPAGRIPYDIDIVYCSAKEELYRIAEDTRMSLSTRKYLMAELRMITHCFEPSRTSLTGKKGI